MAQQDSITYGFRAIRRHPAIFLVELVWRWSFVSSAVSFQPGISWISRSASQAKAVPSAVSGNGVFRSDFRTATAVIQHAQQKQCMTFGKLHSRRDARPTARRSIFY